MSENRSDDLAREVVQTTIRRLTVDLRFLAASLTHLAPAPWEHDCIAVDGSFFHYHPESLCARYVDDSNAVARDYLHAVLHCIFLHPFSVAGKEAHLWDVACDIAVESVIEDLGIDCVSCARSRQISAALIRLKAEVGQSLTAERVYRYLGDRAVTPDDIDRIRQPFYVDDHDIWYRRIEEEDAGAQADGTAREGSSHDAAQRQRAAENGTDAPMEEPADNADSGASSHRGMDDEDITKKEAPENAVRAEQGRFADSITLDRSRERWKNAAYETGVQLDSYVRLWGSAGANLSMNLRNVTREKQQYREFLRKFTHLGEQTRINDDEFDYVYYCYGLQRYGNLPLIEPLEQAEERRIKDFVIAIDTSASTKDGLVRSFIERTYSILVDEQVFFDGMNVLIIQCDAEITDVTTITCAADIERYLENLQVKGLGGTDFRPVFSYVADCIDKGELTDLGGLVYFTDGHGTFPTQKPTFETAFVFTEDPGSEMEIPSWAIRAVLDETVVWD